jgi:hypothetical protein
MRKALKILLLLFLAVSFSCEEEGYFVKCQDCTEDEPVTADLEFKIDPGQSGYDSQIEIMIYEGNLEDKILLDHFITSSSNYTYTVTLKKKYTVTAKYIINNNIYIAVDSAYPRVRYDKNQCDNPCYFVYDRICDLRLKYTK